MRLTGAALTPTGAAREVADVSEIEELRRRLEALEDGARSGRRPRNRIAAAPRPGTWVAALTVVAVAAAGSAQALPGRNTVTSDDIVNGAVRGPDLGRDAVTGPKVRADSLTGADVAESTLGTVPRAEDAATLGGESWAETATQWLNVNADGTVRSFSKSLLGAQVLRPDTEPVGYYCVYVPGDPGFEAAFATVNQGRIPLEASTVTVTTTFAGKCAASTVEVQTFDAAGVLADRAFMLLLPGTPQGFEPD